MAGLPGAPLASEDLTAVMLCMQEFDLATRINDATAQLSVLERCQALPQFKAQHYCKLAAQAEAGAGGSGHSVAAKAALAAALRLMLRQMPQPYPEIAQTMRRLTELCGRDEDKLSMFRDAAALLKALPERAFPPLELEWLAASAWNRSCHHKRFGREAAAHDFMRAAGDLVRHSSVKSGRLEWLSKKVEEHLKEERGHNGPADMEKEASAPAAVSEGGERVKVVVRVRPPFAHETGGAVKIAPDGKALVLYREGSTAPHSGFEFDKVLRENASQADVYQAAVRSIVDDVMQGFNGTVMAYGQTGAGKTYTLSSIQPDAIGMMPRAAAELFSDIANDAVHEYSVTMSYIQIYMELIQDLLRPENNDLQIREGDAGVYVAGVHEAEVAGMEDCLHLLQLGDRNRVFAFTALNAHSSRSHAIVMLTIAKRPRASARRGEKERVRVGRLFLVDLAGSERLKKSRSTGLRASEAMSINLSLTTLGMCINARADPTSTHVPFRDSKLTRLLQESLGGNAKTSLVIAVANAFEHGAETAQSLQFGTRAMRVRTQAVVNERDNFRVINAELVAALDRRDDRTHVLEASLAAQAEALAAAEDALAGERARGAQIMAVLAGEKAAGDAERARLASQLTEAQAEAEGRASAHSRERAELASALAEAEADMARLRRQAAMAADATAAEHAKLQAQAKQAAADAAAALEAAKAQARRAAAAAAAERKRLEQEHATALAVAADAAAGERAQQAAQAQAAAASAARAAAAERQRMAREHAAARDAWGVERAALAADHAAAIATAAQERRTLEEALADAATAAAEERRCLRAEAAAALEAAAGGAQATLAALQERHLRELELELEAAAAVREAAAAAAAGEAAAASERLARSQSALEAAAAAAAQERQRHAAVLRAEEGRWAARQGEANAAAAQALAAARETLSQRDAAIRQLRADAAEAASDLAERGCMIAALRGNLAAAEMAGAQARAERDAARMACDKALDEGERLQGALAATKAALAREEGRVAAAERARAALEAVWAANRQRSGAARTVQRAWRAWHVRGLLQQGRSAAQALHRANAALGELDARQAAAERARQAALAWSGQALVSNSMAGAGALQDAIEALRAAFLLPQKELKTLGSIKRMFGSTGSPMAPLRPRPPAGSPNWSLRTFSVTAGRPFARPSASKLGSQLASPAETPRGSPPPSGPSATRVQPGAEMHVGMTGTLSSSCVPSLHVQTTAQLQDTGKAPAQHCTPPATATGVLAFRHRGGFATLLPEETAANGATAGGLAYARPTGVLLELTRCDLAKLAAFEAGYRQQAVEVLTASGATAHATAFVSAAALRLPQSVPPRRRYRDLLLAGAREHGSPADYKVWLERLPVAEDWAPVGPEYFATPSEGLALLFIGAAASAGLLWFLSASRRRSPV
ncbi:hypothetical protein WJX81_007142 [Elliptochloris bilobata]|uniref:Kinesin motor domain-containing protein n=1 Tax=Elliptochloris bilobata TaxID=381761 RepID=A0AAW1SHM8_9CHLO